MGPPERIAQFKAIETDPTAPQPFPDRTSACSRCAGPRANIADTPAQAPGGCSCCPGAHYSAPELSWKYEVAPAGIGFLDSRELGPQYGDLFVGAARTFLEGGHVWHLNLTGNRRQHRRPRPAARRPCRRQPGQDGRSESESLLFGHNFGIVTDIQTGPDGHLYFVSLSNGVVYEVFRP